MGQENYAHLVKLEKGDKHILRRDDFETLWPTGKTSAAICVAGKCEYGYRPFRGVSETKSDDAPLGLGQPLYWADLEPYPLLHHWLDRTPRRAGLVEQHFLAYDDYQVPRVPHFIAAYTRPA